jgi:hypothetical protein
VLPASPGGHAEYERADDDENAQPLEAGRVVVPPEHDGGDTDRSGEDGVEELHLDEASVVRTALQRRMITISDS